MGSLASVTLRRDAVARGGLRDPRGVPELREERARAGRVVSQCRALRRVACEAEGCIKSHATVRADMQPYTRDARFLELRTYSPGEALKVEGHQRSGPQGTRRHMDALLGQRRDAHGPRVRVHVLNLCLEGGGAGRPGERNGFTNCR